MIGTTSPSYSLDVYGGTGAIHAYSGYKAQPGSGGTPSGNNFNVAWTGTAQLWIDTTNVGTIAFTSDKRIKHDINTLPDSSGIAAIQRLNPVSFYWNNKDSGADLQYGFIAQEAREVYPNLVTNTGMKTPDTPDGMLHFEYNGLFAPIGKAIQELKALFDTDHDTLAKLKADNDNLRAAMKSANDDESAEIKELRAEIEQLKATQH